MTILQRLLKSDSTDDDNVCASAEAREWCLLALEAVDDERQLMESAMRDLRGDS